MGLSTEMCPRSPPGESKVHPPWLASGGEDPQRLPANSFHRQLQSPQTDARQNLAQIVLGFRLKDHAV